MLNYEMAFPNQAEQEKIASYFDDLDNLITLHQRIIANNCGFNACVWEQRKLGELAYTFEYGLNAAAKEFDGENKYIRITDIDDCSHEFIKDGITSPDIDLSIADNYKLAIGDILFARTGASVGKTYIYNDSDGLVYYAGFLIRARIKEKFNPEFVFQNTLTEDYAKYIAVTSQRSGQPGVNAQEYSDYAIMLPNKEEQDKISDYLLNLDHLITLHQCKCMFYGNYVQNDWEQRKLGDVADIVGGGTPSTNKSSYWNGKIDWYAPAEIGDEIYLYSSKKQITQDGFNNSSARMLPVGTVLFTSRAGIGKTAILAKEGCTNQGFQSIVPHKNELDSYFIFSRTDELKRYGEVTGAGSTFVEVSGKQMSNMNIMLPSTIKEQIRLGNYFKNIDNLITLHQCKCILLGIKGQNAWEQRKLSELTSLITKGTTPLDKTGNGKINFVKIESIDSSSGEINITSTISEEEHNGYLKRSQLQEGDVLFSIAGTLGRVTSVNKGILPANTNQALAIIRLKSCSLNYITTYLKGKAVSDFVKKNPTVGAQPNLSLEQVGNLKIALPNIDEQERIGTYFHNLDNLITLHQQKYIYIEISLKYIKITLFITKETIIMPELESMIENKLIEQLVYGDSQWNYRDDLKTEEDLWKNFRYILEQNNKDRLNGEQLSDSEFEQVKNQLQFSSFYKAGEWLVGENGKVQVHVQRDTEKLHLVVMNHEHIAGGSSVYEVINQYSVLAADDDKSTISRDRRFDVTLMINGLPMIHIELKNKQHSYMDGFWQIKKYIGEGKFTGIFSAVQMFVISNGVNTKYFSAASDTELNPKFISGWLDTDNNPVPDYLDFAKYVLRIPEAHEMIARYTVLDEDAKRLILLRPYQIHAIEAIREASKTGKSGFVWHTTGSGKTLTSYKATRNLLMDIPAIDKAIFLIDRKDLDTQTTMAFQAYANNDLIDVNETDNVNDLKKKLKSDDRQVIVTTIQKLYMLVTKRLKEGTTEYNKIKNLKIAYVVDECHRAVTPSTKREIERFFGNSLWFGFTGTPRFKENPYPQLGDLPRTTESLYGERLHKYTIQNAIHDNAVLGFQVEHIGPKNIEDETDASAYDNETHMLKVLDVILNKSYNKLGFQNGKGQTYEGLLTTSSIQLAQKYYDLLTRVKNGETSLVIDEKIKQVLPDFPKFAITYSVTENEEGSHVNQQKMQESLDDYNKMFNTKYEISQIQGYNGNLNKRLARKDTKFKSRNEQLDLVIVVDRLLTGFDAPCMSTIFIDRQPMGPHDLIQAFSRTNRIFDKNKTYGQIVTFQAPVLFKESVDNAVKLYSAGGTKDALLADWDEIEKAFRKSLAALRVSAETPDDVSNMSDKEKEVFAKMFQNFDTLFAQLKSFTNYDDSMLDDYGVTEKEYDDYAGHYLNVVEELKAKKPEKEKDIPETEVDPDYELMAYSNTKIDYEYIINLIQNIVTPADDSEPVSPEERQKKLDEVKQYVEDLRKENPKVADIMSNLISEIELDENKYKGQSILNIVENMKHDCIDKVITDFCIYWYASKDDVMYAATHYRNGDIPNESAIKATIDYTSYKEAQEHALPKFKYYAQLMSELRKTLDEEIKPLINH